MSRHSTATSANKATSRMLRVTYEIKPLQSGSFSYFEIHRFASKTYRYIGLTEAAAQSCQAEKIAQFTRTKLEWKVVAPPTEEATDDLATNEAAVESAESALEEASTAARAAKGDVATARNELAQAVHALDQFNEIADWEGDPEGSAQALATLEARVDDARAALGGKRDDLKAATEDVAAAQTALAAARASRRSGAASVGGDVFSSSATTETMARISVVANCDAWDCEIDVDEDDVVLSLVSPDDPADLFVAINAARNYDEEPDDALRLAGALRTTVGDAAALSVVFDATITDFDGDALGCEVASSPSATFAALARATDAYDSPLPGYIYIAAGIPSPVYVRLVYGNYISNVVEVA